MDLFDYMRENTMEKESPLASRLRPSTLDEGLIYLSRPPGNGKDHFSQGHCQYHQRRL